jgi:AbrB family looped-hinge helix DNA binding protein
MVKYTTMTKKGQITLPVEMRRALNLEPGKKLNITFQDEKLLISKPVDVEEVRRELREQMAQRETEKSAVQNGDGWTAHVREKHGR